MFNRTNNGLGFSTSLLHRPLRSGRNEFAEDERGLVVVTHGRTQFLPKKSANLQH